jgi:hypothetical protein
MTLDFGIFVLLAESTWQATHTLDDVLNRIVPLVFLTIMTLVVIRSRLGITGFASGCVHDWTSWSNPVHYHNGSWQHQEYDKQQRTCKKCNSFDDKWIYCDHGQNSCPNRVKST